MTFHLRAVGCIVGEALETFLFLCYIILFRRARHAWALPSIAFMSAAGFRRLLGCWALDLISELGDMYQACLDTPCNKPILSVQNSLAISYQSS